MSQNEICLTRAFRDWWTREREHASNGTALIGLANILWEFLRDSLPTYRRQRYGDADYDWEFRVDTTAATVSWRTRLLGLFNSPYQPVPPEEFQEIMIALARTMASDFRQFTFIDIGSGKGRALLLAKQYEFRRIIGVEVLPELHQIAHENVRNLQESAPNTSIELLCQDATQFIFPPEPSVIFLFNPLRPASLSKLVKKIEASVAQSPRPLYVAYANPVLEHVMASCQFLTNVARTRQYSIFAYSAGVLD